MSRRRRCSYPAPHAFTDGAGTTIGYKGDVVFPVRVMPRQTDKPVTLRAQGRLCGLREAVRAGRGEARADACAGRRAPTNAALDAAEARVPKPVTAARSRADRQARQRRQGEAAGVRRSRRADRRAGRLFAEGPTPEWALPIPQAGARRARRTPAFRLRARRPAARRRSQGAVRTDVHHRRSGDTRDRGHRPVSTRRRRSALCFALQHTTSNRERIIHAYQGWRQIARMPRSA